MLHIFPNVSNTGIFQVSLYASSFHFTHKQDYKIDLRYDINFKNNPIIW